MPENEAALTRTMVGMRRSLSDRPGWQRTLVHSGHFFARKPLGGAGVVLIFAVLFMAAFAGIVSPHNPEAVAKVSRPACDAATERLIQEAITAGTPLPLNAPQCYSPFLLARAETDSFVRLQFPAELFQQGDVALVNGTPSADHLLGTDRVGRDLLSRIIYGSRLALLVGVGAALIAVTFGTVFGVVSAYFGGWVDMAIQRVTDAFFSFPPLILLLVFSQVVENPNKYWNTIALGIIGVAGIVRVARSAVLTAREEVYVLAARTIGASDRRVMARHILPNILAPLIVVFTTSIGAYILAEAGLAFIGLGDPTAISWGKMVNEGRALGPAKPLMALFVGLAITLTVLGFNLAGDALRDVLDPRLRGRGGRAGF